MATVGDAWGGAVLAALGLAARVAVGAPPAADDLAGYRRAEPPVENIRLENPDFNAGMEGWRQPDGYTRDPAGGRNGTGGLKFSRSDAGSYLLASQDLDLVPGARYRFSAWVRTEGVRGDEAGATLCLEFLAGDAYHSGEYPVGLQGTTGWTLIEGETTVPEAATRSQLTLYLRQGMTGTAWFDDVSVRPTGPAWHAYLISPSHETLDPAGGRCVIRSVLRGMVAGRAGKIVEADLACRVRAAIPGRPAVRSIAPVRQGRIAVELGKLPPGRVSLALTLLDTRRKLILGDTTIEAAVAAPPTNPNGCRIDEHGTAVVDGKPFLPVGLYCGGLSRADIARIGAGPFNCVMPYGSLDLKLDGSNLDGVAAIRETLDACAAGGLKVIFSSKDVYTGIWSERTSFAGATGEAAVIAKSVGSFKDHPALLAWYINDERPLTMADRLIARRREVNRLDPAHPTWAVLYQFDQLNEYGDTCDILGVDPYPIKHSGNRDMLEVLRALDGAARATATADGQALWVVPQIFNQGSYGAADRAALAREYRDPTEEEMRAMSLLCAIRGAKGFIFYSYFDLVGPVTLPDFDRRWPEICRVGGVLRDLAPLLLSPKSVAQPTIESAAGRVFARAFADESGRRAVLIAGTGPGESRADLILPATRPLRSRYGLTIPVAPGRYRFTGRDICSDILEP